MASTRATGNRFQDWIQVWLEKQGWLVHNQKGVATKVKTPRGEIWVSKRQDIFGCIDLIAKKNGQTLWIQATTHKSLKEKVKQIMSRDLTFSEDDYPMIFIKRDRDTVDVYGLITVRNYPLPDIDPDHFGKIIRRKFFAAQGINWEF